MLGTIYLKNGLFAISNSNHLSVDFKIFDSYGLWSKT